MLRSSTARTYAGTRRVLGSHRQKDLPVETHRKCSPSGAQRKPDKANFLDLCRGTGSVVNHDGECPTVAPVTVGIFGEDGAGGEGGGTVRNPGVVASLSAPRAGCPVFGASPGHAKYRIGRAGKGEVLDSAHKRRITLFFFRITQQKKGKS